MVYNLKRMRNVAERNLLASGTGLLTTASPSHPNPNAKKR